MMRSYRLSARCQLFSSYLKDFLVLDREAGFGFRLRHHQSRGGSGYRSADLGATLRFQVGCFLG